MEAVAGWQAAKMTDAPPEIRLFVAAFETRSFTAAARRENATQSGVSQHIRKLEDRFGVKLFARGPSEMVPTPAGERFYQHCLDMLRAHARAAVAMRGFADTLEGEILVGLMPTMTRCVLAPALARFLDLHPNVSVRIVEAYSAVLTERVQAGELAFAVVPAGPTGPGLRSRLFARTPEVLVAACGRLTPHGEPIRLAGAGPLKIVLPGPQNTRRKTLESYFAANGVEVARTLQLDAMLGTLDLVARTDWVAVVPGVMMATDLAEGAFCVRRLADPPLALDLVLIEATQRPPEPAAAAFLDVLEEETKRMNAAWDLGADE